jgi:tetratricopeptide (TPR) repeat protein
LKCFDEAISAEPESKRAITGKGRIKMLSTDYQGALEDAQTVLDMDKEDIHALYLKASALYNLNEYENSLVLYHRGKHIRKQPPIFDRGLMNVSAEFVRFCYGYKTRCVIVRKELN